MPRVDPATIDPFQLDDTGRDIVSAGHPTLVEVEADGAKGWQVGIKGLRPKRFVLDFEGTGWIRLIAETDAGDIVEYEATDLQLNGQFMAVANHGPIEMVLPAWEPAEANRG